MRNFKKVVALVLAVALAMSTWTVAFAAETTNADKLVTLGLLSDASATSLSAGLTREIGLTMILKDLGYTQADADKAPAAPFTDTKGWVVKWANLAYEKGITKGVTATTFGGSAKLAGDVFLTFALRGLGVTVAKTSDALATAITAGLLPAGSTLPTSFTKADAAGIMFASLSFVDPTTKVSLLDKLIAAKVVTEANAIAAGLKAAVPAALEVKAVTTTNAKEIVIAFNKAVNETEAKKVANYSVKKADDTDLGVSAVALSDDKTTVTLTVTTALTNYSTDNKVKVLKAVGLAADYENKAVGVTDATIPTLVSVSASGPRELTLTFSEPVKGITNAAFKLDNGTVALGAVSAASGTKVTLATLADLTVGAHTLTLAANSAISDEVNLVVKPGSYAFDFAKDTVAPTVTVKESSEYTVTLKFSKNVNNVKTAAVLYSHTYDGKNQVLGNAAVTGSGDEYVVTFINPLAPGVSNVYIGYATGTTDANKIKDNYGNILAPVTLQVTTTVDNVAPVAEKVEFKTSTTAEVTFSEKVTTATAQDKANYTLKDADAKAVTISNAVLDASGKVVTLTFTAINGGNYTLTVKGVKDISIAANKVADTTLTFTASDKVNPTVTDVDTTDADIDAQTVAAKKVIIKYSEAMDSTSITSKDNYLVGGVALASGDTVEAIDGNKSALITFAVAPGNTTITVGRVKDVAGNMIAAFSTPVVVTSTVSKPLYDKAEVTSKNTVKLYFKEVITGAIAKDFAVNPGTGVFEAATGIAVTVADGKTEITLTIASDMTAANIAAGNVRVQTVADASADAATFAAATGAANQYGAKVYVGLAAAATPADKSAPTVVTDKYETQDVDGDGKIDHIKITFDEAIFAGSVALDKFTVAGYTVKDAYTVSAGAPTTAADRTGATSGNGTVLYVRVAEKDDADGAATPKVSIAAGLTDVAGNAFAAVTEKDTKDKVAAVILTATRTGANAITLTFSEPVYSVNDGTGALAVTDVRHSALGTVADAEDLAGITHTAGATTATVTTTTATVANTSTVGPAANGIFDAVGNVSPTIADGTVETLVK